MNRHYEKSRPFSETVQGAVVVLYAIATVVSGALAASLLFGVIRSGRDFLVPLLLFFLPALFQALICFAAYRTAKARSPWFYLAALASFGFPALVAFILRDAFTTI